jgi:hypothetical protein
MPNRTIYVSQNGNSGTLKLRDSEGHNPGNDDLTTDVGSGDTVTWVLDPNASGVNAIYSIESITYSPPQDGPPPKYQGSTPVLYQMINGVKEVNGNASKDDNGVMTGYVDSGIAANTIENYQIGYKKVAGGSTLYDDPRLKMT